MVYVLTLMAAEELNGVHEARVERGGPAHPRRPGAPLRSACRQGGPGGRALERASLRLEVASAPGRVAAVRRRAEPQAEARGLRARARVCEEPYLAALFSVRRRRAWFWRRRLRQRRCVTSSARRGGWRTYPEGEIRQVPLQHWRRIKQWKNVTGLHLPQRSNGMEDGPKNS